MPFRVKNGPPTFQIIVDRTFKESLDQFVNFFLMISWFIMIKKVIL
jgi:hypothetical protein